MPQKADAYVIPRRRPDDSVEYVVRPACIVVAGPQGQAKPKVLIRNLTGIADTVVDLLGKEDPDSQGNSQRRQGRNSPYDVFDITLKREDGFFPFKVTVGGVPAKGESDPVIIIDPPCS